MCAAVVEHVAVEEEVRAERRRILVRLLEGLDELERARGGGAARRDPGLSRGRRALRRRTSANRSARHYRVKLAALLEDRMVTLRDIAFVRAAATRRARAGFALEDYLNAFRVGQQAFWEAVVACAGETPLGHAAALTLAGPLMRYCDFASTHAAHAYVEYQQYMVADADRERRDLLEHLLAGEMPTRGPLLAAARPTASPRTRGCWSPPAVTVDARADADAPHVGSAAIACAGLHDAKTLVVVRQTEIVAILVARRRTPIRAGCAIASTRCSAGCAGGHRAGDGRQHGGRPASASCRAPTRRRTWPWPGVGEEGGVAALARLTPFDYLALRADDTARRLVDPHLRAFLDEDRRRGGVAHRDDPRGRRRRPQPAPGGRAPAGPPQHRPVPPAPDRGAHRTQPAADRRPARPARGNRPGRRARRRLASAPEAHEQSGEHHRRCSTPPSSSPPGAYRLGEPGDERDATLAARAHRPLAGRQRTRSRASCAPRGRDVAPALARKLADPLLADHPATDVTYERRRGVLRVGAAAGCPTGDEWEAAARGDDGRAWPWGDDFDPERCACAESGWGWTAPVDRAPGGRRPVRRRAARRQRLGVGVRPHRGRRLARGARRLLPRPRVGRARRARAARRPGARHAHHRLSHRHRPREAPVTQDPATIIDALREVYDPCCADRGISIVDMGVVEDVRVDGAHVDVDLVLTTGLVPVRGHHVLRHPRSPARPRRRRDRRRPGRLGPGVDARPPVGVGARRAQHAARGARALPRAPARRERSLTMATETAPDQQAARERKVDAFVFDCVCHIFNFDPANALGPPGADVRRAPLRLPPAAHQGGRAGPLARGVHEGVERRRDLRHGHRGLRHRHDRRPAAAAHRPLPRRPVAVGEVRRDGRQAPRPRGLLGLGQPARGQEGARPHDAPGRGPRREGVQVLQRALRLRAAVPVAHGRPAHRLPGVRARAGARRQPDRRPQGRAARAAADRAHAHVRHGRRGGQLPRHQLRHLPRRAAVARRGAVADRALPEPLRVDRRDGQLHLAPAAGVRRDARAR